MFFITSWHDCTIVSMHHIHLNLPVLESFVHVSDSLASSLDADSMEVVAPCLHVSESWGDAWLGELGEQTGSPREQVLECLAYQTQRENHCNESSKLTSERYNQWLKKDEMKSTKILSLLNMQCKWENFSCGRFSNICWEFKKVIPLVEALVY